MDTPKKKIPVINYADSAVSYFLEDRRIRRLWTVKGQKILIDAEEIREALYEPGIRNLFTEGYLGMENAIDREYVELDVPQVVSYAPFNDIAANKLMALNDIEELKTKIKKLAPNGRDTLIRKAVESDNINYNVVNAIKEVTNIDVMKIKENNK